jgi:hypothetical protein
LQKLRKTCREWLVCPVESKAYKFQEGTVVPENESAERAGLKPEEILLLRPNAVKGGSSDCGK